MNVYLPAFSPPKMSMSIFLVLSGFMDFLLKVMYDLLDSFIVIKVCLSDTALSYSATEVSSVKLSIGVTVGRSGSC